MRLGGINDFPTTSSIRKEALPVERGWGGRGAATLNLKKKIFIFQLIFWHTCSKIWKSYTHLAALLGLIYHSAAWFWFLCTSQQHTFVKD